MHVWHRINASGVVVGIAQGDYESAALNVGPGERLEPAAGPLKRVTSPRPEDDPRFMRRTGYPTVSEQVGALMKVVPALLSGDPVSSAARDELLALAARVAAVKSANPL